MPYQFAVIDSRICLPTQKQDAALARLGEALSQHPMMQKQADEYLFEYRRSENTPISFVAMLELWGWSALFDLLSNNLLALTSERTETEGEQVERLFLDALAPDLEDGNFVEVEIDHERRRYVVFQGELYQFNVSYMYPPLCNVIAQTKGLHPSQKELFPDELQRNLCICTDPRCSGCSCGNGCAYAPGHEEGPKAIDPIEALIEAVNSFLVDAADRDDDKVLSDQEDEYDGSLYPDYRQLYAALALARKYRAACATAKERTRDAFL